MGRASRQKRIRNAVCAFMALCLVGLVTGAPAADLTRAELQAMLLESVAALFTGQAFSPALQQKQQAMRKMLASGAFSKAELKSMVEANMLPILNRYETSRYVLKKINGRVETLFSPYLSWEEINEMAWKAAASLIPDGQQMVVKIGTMAPSGTPWINLPETVLIPRIDKLSNDKFTIKIFTGGVMGEDTDVLRKMDIGQLDGCGCTALGILAASPEASVLLLPGLFRNYAEVDYITDKFRKKFDETFEKRGYILGAFIDSGFFYLFSKENLTSLADLKKRKVLTWLGEVEPTLFKQLGVDVTPVAVPEIVSALSTGMADTNVAPAAWMIGMQAYQYMKCFITQPFFYSPGAVFVSGNTKARLTRKFGLSETLAENFQEMLVHEVSAIEAEWKKQLREYEQKCLKAFELKCGMKPVTLSAADQKTLDQAFLNVREDLAGKAFPRDFMEEILKALKEYRAGKQ